MSPEPVTISRRRLHLLAALLGLAGTAAVILQARYWIPPGQATGGVLWLTAWAPLIGFAVFWVVPQRARPEETARYPLVAPLAWVNLALPAVLSLFALLLVGVSGSYDSFAGFGLLVAVNAGRNLREALRRAA